MKRSSWRDISTKTTNRIASQLTANQHGENRPSTSLLYDSIIKEICNPAMAVLPILFLYTLYNPTLFDHLLTPLSLVTGLLFPTVGALYESDLEKPRVLTYGRVSTKSQVGTSLPHQKEMNERSVKSMDGIHVDNIEERHTGTELDRDGLNQVRERAEKDEFDVLAVTEIDRLTRAEVFDSIRLFEELSEQDVALYVNSIGVVDWDDLFNLDTLFREAIFARRWINRIKGGAESAYADDFKQGKWTPSKTPFGYKTDEENYLKVDEEKEEIIQKTFELYLEFENRQKTVDRLNELYEFEFEDESEDDETKNDECEECEGDDDECEECEEEDKITDSRVETLLTSRLCIGQFCIRDPEEDGYIAAKEPDLQVVDKEIFFRAQCILEKRSNRGETQKFPESLNEALARFGLDYLVSKIDALSYQCPKCDGEFEKYGSGDVMGDLLSCYKCEDCGYQNTLFRKSEFRELDQTLPLRCPHCPHTGDFECDEVSGSFGEYLYTCQHCEHSFKSTSDPDMNKFERAFEHSEHTFEMDNSTQEPAHSHTPPTDDTTEDEPTDTKQATLSSLTDGVQ